LGNDVSASAPDRFADLSGKDENGENLFSKIRRAKDASESQRVAKAGLKG
jgi:hypothetical protein